MSAVQRALKDRPLAYYKLDDSTPFDDYSGYGRTATATGTTTSIGLANGCNYSTVFGSSSVGTFASPVFVQGKESDAFSLEATVMLIQQSDPSPVTLPYRENLYHNPSMDTTKYVSTYNGAGTPVSSPVLYGTQSLQYNGSASNTGDYGLFLNTGAVATEAIPVTPNTTYTFSAHATGSASNTLPANVSIRVNWVDGAGGYVWNDTGTTQGTIPTDGTWKRFHATFTAPAGAVYASWRLIVGQNMHSQVYWFDGFMVEAGQLGTYFDGSMSGYQWAGTAGDSKSVTTVSSLSEIQVLSHLGTYDGLMLMGKKIIFTTKYLTSGECRVEYEMQEIQKAHIVGVHTPEKNVLYVNGEQVGSTAITSAQKADTYIATNGNLYAGLTTSTQQVAINGLAVYSSALSAQTIREHYEEAFRNVPEAYSGFQGFNIPLDYSYANVVISRTFSTYEDWQDGLVSNLDITDGLKPVVSDGVSTAGTWHNVVLLESTGVTSMQEVYLDWSGTGAIVEASLDGSTWEVAYKGVGLSIIPAGYNPTGKVLQIRVTLTNPTDTLTSLTVRGVGSGSYTVGTRTVTIAGEGAIRKEFNPRTLSVTSGVALRGGSLTISTDTDPAAVVPRTVEIWMRRTGSGTATFSSNIGSAGTFYSNGVTGSGYPTGEWVVRHFINASGIAGNIVISGNIEIGRVVVYSTVLTAAQIKKLYDSYVGVASTRLNETASLAITQPSDAAQTYAHAWQITTTG